MPDVTVKLSDGIREITGEYNGADDDPLTRAEDSALRMYRAVTATTPPDRRTGFAGWALNSDTERAPEE